MCWGQANIFHLEPLLQDNESANLLLEWSHGKKLTETQDTKILVSYKDQNNERSNNFKKKKRKLP